MFRRSLLVAVFAASFAATASAETVKFQTSVTPNAEVPPTTSKGSGEAAATLDTTTHQLTYDVTFQGFASPVTAAHFHGPAAAQKNAKVQVPLGNNPKSPLHGSATLTAAQQQQLMAGEWYVNVHSVNHPAGAIRGQMIKAQ
ncbi:MAG: CHRD domain-containing protein [Pseudomonadota bacterium]|nr:CHRD domain-containing protein [Pseudomonadota bacterium]